MTRFEKLLGEYSSGVKALRAVDKIFAGLATSGNPEVVGQLRAYRLDMASDILKVFDPNLFEQIGKEMLS